MRKPKHKALRNGLEEHVHDFIAHAPSESFVRVRVSETEFGFTSSVPGGTLILDLERVDGNVMIRWTDADGKPRQMTLARKGS